MNDKRSVLNMKYTRIILCISEYTGWSLEKSMDVFYNSELLPLIDQGIADLHCRSDQYLAKEIIRDSK